MCIFEYNTQFKHLMSIYICIYLCIYIRKENTKPEKNPNEELLGLGLPARPTNSPSQVGTQNKPKNPQKIPSSNFATYQRPTVTCDVREIRANQIHSNGPLGGVTTMCRRRRWRAVRCLCVARPPSGKTRYCCRLPAGINACKLK